MSNTRLSSLIKLIRRQGQWVDASAIIAGFIAVLAQIYAGLLVLASITSRNHGVSTKASYSELITLLLGAIMFVVYYFAHRRYRNLRSVIILECQDEFNNLLKIELVNGYRVQRLDQLPDSRHKAIKDRVAENMVDRWIERAEINDEINGKIYAAT